MHKRELAAAAGRLHSAYPPGAGAERHGRLQAAARTVRNVFRPRLAGCCILLAACCHLPALQSAGGEEAPATAADFARLMAERQAEATRAYDASPFSALTRDFLSRYVRDPDRKGGADEVAIDAGWKVVLPVEGSALGELMGSHVVEFMAKRMGVDLATEKRPRAELSKAVDRGIVLLESGGGDPDTPESFTLAVRPNEVRVAGRDPAGLRDGVVKLVDLFGFNQAALAKTGEQVYRPRLRARIGNHGSCRDTVFMGYNAVLVGSLDLYGISTSDAIPELSVRREAGALDETKRLAGEARRYGLRTYAHLHTLRKFKSDDPVLKANPDIRGTLAWAANGEYTLCTEHPLVRRYLSESVAGLFRDCPQLDGVQIIVGGENFYHCFMRPYGKEKGHTNCARCEALGPDKVVSNLCNYLAAAARSVNPHAEVIAWLYSAEQVWSADRAQSGFIMNLQPGVSVLCEIEKDEVLLKPGGIEKPLWDYSIDLVGPCQRAREQIKLCTERRVPIYILSMPEDTYDAALLPHIPCMDRWADRAIALASCGGTGAYLAGRTGPYEATSAAEINRFFWWDPAPDKEQVLQQFAARLAGHEAAAGLRRAWAAVSAAVPCSLRIGPYFKGPHYLGPAHPMFADRSVAVPEVFNGYYLFHGEIAPGLAMQPEPTYVKTLEEAMGLDRLENAETYIAAYRRMESYLKQAAAEMTAASRVVPERCRLMFAAEDYPVQWYYHSVRTEANFYESCYLRDQLFGLAGTTSRTEQEAGTMRRLYGRWKEVLQDERQNTLQSLPIAQADVRLDAYQRGDHSFPHLTDMMTAKLKLLTHDLDDFVPGLAGRWGLAPE